MNRVLAASALVALTACGLPGDEAQLLVPDDVELHWDRAFNGEDDGLSVLLPVDVMVYDGTTGEPVEGAPIELTGSIPGASLVEPRDVELVGPDAPSDLAWWDAWRDRYFEFASEGAADSEVTLTTETDATGLARVYVFVDRFPELEGSSFEPAPVTVSMGEMEETFFLIPR